MLLRREDPPPVELLAAPVLEGERYQNRPIYFSDVIVRRDSDLSSGFEALRGRSWAYNDPLSHSGYNLTRYELIRRGETRSFFGKVVEAGSHLNAMRLVAAGEVDGSAIDSQILAVSLRESPELEHSLRVIDVFGPSTIQPVVAASRLSGEIKEGLRGVLFDLEGDARARSALAYGLVRRFTPVGDADYDDIRRMLTAAEESGFMRLR